MGVAYELLTIGTIRWLHLVIQKRNTDCICGFLFLLIDNLRIYLCCGHLPMTKHFTDSIDVGSVGELQGCVSMSKAVEGDVLRNTRGFYPSFHRSVNP